VCGESGDESGCGESGDESGCGESGDESGCGESGCGGSGCGACLPAGLSLHRLWVHLKQDSPLLVHLKQ
jgi:hypothetical protein